MRINLKRESESLLLAEHNNAIRTNYVKVKIYNTQLNSMSMLWGERDETVNHIVSKCFKLARKR